MFAFHVEAPAGTDRLDVALDFLLPPSSSGFSSGASATAHLLVLSWNQVLLYPAGARASDVKYSASLRMPAGWKFATALPAGGRIAPGRFLRHRVAGNAGGLARHHGDLVAHD